MPQTMLGLLALALAMLLSMQRQQASVDRQFDRIRTELAVQSTTVAEDVLNVVGSMSFDRATSDPDAPSLMAATQLTSASDFGTGGGQPRAIEDFHDNIGNQFKRRIIRRTDPQTGVALTDTLHFEVDLRVAYVNENDLVTPTGQQSKAKMATVTVYATTIARPDTIRISRSFVCGTRCAW